MARGAAACVTAALLASVLAGCGGKRQDANEPKGSFKLEVENASFPTRQAIAHASVLRIRVRNADSKAVPNVAVTVETRAQGSRTAAPVAFGQRVANPELADPTRPIWILDRGPHGGDSADTDTWTLGPLQPGAARTFEWHLTPVVAGRYSVGYHVYPGLYGKAKAAGGPPRGTFDVMISDTPVPARVDDNGNVVRGEEAGR